MAVTHSTAARNAATDAVTALLGANSQLAFRLAGALGDPGVTVATLLMEASTAPFNASSNGTATAKPIASDTNAAGDASEVATATLQTSAFGPIIHFQVGTSGSDITINRVVIGAGDTVACSNLTYTALPS